MQTDLLNSLRELTGQTDSDIALEEARLSDYCAQARQEGGRRWVHDPGVSQDEAGDRVLSYPRFRRQLW